MRYSPTRRASAALHGDPASLCQGLASEGLHIERKKQYDLADYLNGADVSGRVTRVETTGWHRIRGADVFVLPSETIGPATAEHVILEGAANAPYESLGSLEDWRAGVGCADQRAHPSSARRIGRARRPVAFLGGRRRRRRSFLRPIIKGQDDHPSGRRVRLGPWRFARICRGVWRATMNALEGAAALATDTALVLDEMGVLDARDAGAAIYSLANGGGKQRAARDGSLREPKSWRLSFVSSGEVPLEAKLSEGKGKARAGQLLRLLDLPADRGLGFGVFDNGGSHGDAGALARAIKFSANAAYGTAGPEFVRRIVAENINGDDVRAMAADFVKAECPTGADGQVERVAHRLGLIAAAGEIAIAVGVAPWRAGEVRNAAAWALRAWLANRGGAEPAEVRQAIQQVRLYIEQHGDSRFDPLERRTSRVRSLPRGSSFGTLEG